MQTSILPIIFVFAASSVAEAQTSAAPHVWRDGRGFDPYSRTAESITGRIKLSGLKPRADAGGKMTLRFGNGKTITLTSLGVQRRRWDFVSKAPADGEVFAIDKDPGRLLNGNILCGKEPARYFVFYDEPNVVGGALLGLNVFSSTAPPADIDAKNLCGTFNYVR